MKQALLLWVIFSCSPLWADYPTTMPTPQPSATAIAMDVLLARPAGLVATVVGGALWTLSLPFTLPSQSVEPVTNALIRQPVYFTFERPLGADMPDF